jgi:hypothetical protein
MKKLEPMINTIAPVISYIFRCNTDVTNLRSGTAIKGVLSYCTDYITKPGLKTWAIFEAIRNVIQKGVEVIGSVSLSRQEKARQLMTRLVNSIGSKMELGSPMVSLYLLNNPDHYTNCKFAPFYWSQFVLETMSSWNYENQTVDTAKVIIVKKKNRIVGLSLVSDYMYRSPILKNMDLYTWISRCKREKHTDKRDVKVSITERSNNNLDIDSLSDHSEQADFEESIDDTRSTIYHFTTEHPLFSSHVTRCASIDKSLIPDIVGAPLPRRDQGDREYYCATMLTFFKPWRTGKDLKSADQTWDDAFAEFSFTAKQLKLMDHFNLRYEYLDGRDDFHAQMRKGAGIATSWDSDVINDIDQSNIEYHDEHSSGDVLEEEIKISDKIGPRQRKALNSVKEMTDIMNRQGWGMPKENNHIRKEDPMQIEVFQPGVLWKSVIAQKRQEVLDERLKKIPSGIMTASGKVIYGAVSNDVKIIDKNYFEKICQVPEWKDVIARLTNEYSLNDEQKRAFHIVANHIALNEQEQLKMYIGGMGGTGKSQVLKTLKKYFTLRNESYRFAIVAPTGNAAALLGGSTYHHLFGINDLQQLSNATIGIIKDRLVGIDYIFFDEVSMLSCRDLFRISERLSLIMNCSLPFGGLNFIFAGDFAQLPPAIGGENTSLYSHTVGIRSTTKNDQEAALGKAYWHQVNTIVILRKNMRQQEQSKDDKAFRTALENMRYKDCTPADLAFLRTRISKTIPGSSSIADDEFRNVPIITALNVHKDAINLLGSHRFSIESGHKLVNFYSEDTICYKPDTNKRNKGHTVSGNKRELKSLSSEIQILLWNALPSSSENISGKLSLCIGMPVMIRHNGATELCITKGQEGTVYGWQSVKGSQNQLMLDTLFVKLTDPPYSIKLDGLPKNVVPLTRSTNTITCSLPDDTTIQISRSQVEVISNFSMTDFAAQGKTRKYNAVNLNSSRSHQAFYTALSRSATAAGTLILQGFDCKKIVGRASGALRQEFRALELLDYITKLRYESRLPCTVIGETRNELISSFRKWKGESFIPPNVHRSIRWSKSDPYLEDVIVEINKSYITESAGLSKPKDKSTSGSKYQNSKSQSITNEIVSTVQNISDLKSFAGQKRKFIQAPSVALSQAFKKKCLIGPSIAEKHENNRPAIVIPLGLQWKENSCAYDATLTILYNTWQENPIDHTQYFSSLNLDSLFYLSSDFQRVLEGTYAFQDVRDRLRYNLEDICPDVFTWGEETSVHSLLLILLKPVSPFLSSKYLCSARHTVAHQRRTAYDSCILILSECSDIQEYIDNDMAVESNASCYLCGSRVYKHFTFTAAPGILSFDLSAVLPEINDILMITTAQKSVKYQLKGIIYYRNNHFTSRIIGPGNMVWFHDGLQAYSSGLQYEGLLSSLPDLQRKDLRYAVAAIYCLKSGS